MMQEKLFEFIKELSISDKKSLLGKALKVGEEQGELAKVILPYENAYATTHRFVTDKQILEESVDTILAAISLPYSIGYTTEDIIEMIQKKSAYWAELQAREVGIAHIKDIPYEIHVTVEKPKDIELFKNVCKNIGVKPIVLDLENNKGELLDVMTSSHYYGNNIGAYKETRRIARELSAYFYLIREKIETFPFHPAAPSDKHAFPKMPANCYFESHLSVIISSEAHNTLLQDLVKKHDAHLSRNFFKKISDEEYIKMITLRSYTGTYENFKKGLELLKRDLGVMGFVYEKEIVEFCIYDTKISHDFQWLGKEELIS